MNLGKVKNFLIVLFLGINIYLVLTTYFSSRFFVDKKAVSGCVTLLEEKGITLDPGTVPKYTVNLMGIDTKNVIHSNDKLKAQNPKIDGNSFSLEVSLDNLGAKDAERLSEPLKKYFKSLGFNTKYMKFSKSKKDDVWYINCAAGEYPVFDSFLTASVEDGVCTIEGAWNEPQSGDVISRSTSRSTVYITSILVSMAQNEEIVKNAPFKIESIEFGYLASKPYGDAPSITTTALPYYRIQDSKGNVYYYDAENGTYLKVLK